MRTPPHLCLLMAVPTRAFLGPPPPPPAHRAPFGIRSRERRGAAAAGGVPSRPRRTAAEEPSARLDAEKKNGGGGKKDGDDDFDDLTYRAEKMRLEEANTKSFLKRRPRKLPYEDARRWVQANLGPETEEEFNDLVENGNLRTPYIPKRPQEYYTETREWISWDHFLKGIFDGQDSQPSSLKPPTGVFD